MLQSIRDHAKGWLAYVVVGFISIPFVFWGVQEYVGGGGNRLIAEVNGVEILEQDFQRALKQQQSQIRSIFGGNIPAALMEGGGIQQTVINSMIRNELLRQYSTDAGFKVGDGLVRDAIKNQPFFQQDGKFSPKKYKSLLEQQRMTKAGFEQQIRSDLQNDQFQKAITSSVIVTLAEDKNFLSLKNQEREIIYLKIPRSLVSDQVSISEAAIKEYYSSNQDRFMTDERVKVQYLVLDPKVIEQQISIPEGELERLYEQENSRYTSVESRRAGHILLKLVDDSESTEQLAREQLLEILSRINAGEDFGVIAAEISADSLSKGNNGDLGFISKGDMDPVFEKALFALQPDEVSDPVKSALGLHLIKLLEVRPVRQKPFIEVKEQVEREYREREADRLLLEYGEQLLTLTYETSDSLGAAADALGIPVKETGWISRSGGEGLGSNPDIVRAAFSDEVLIQGHNSDVIETQDGQQIVIRIGQRKQAEAKPLDSAKPEIERILRQKSEKEKLQEIGKLHLAQLNSGTDMGEIAAELSIEVKNPGYVARDSKNIPAEILQRAFKLNVASSGSSSSSVTFADGAYGLLVLKSVKQGDRLESESDIAGADEVIQKTLSQREFDAAYRALESRAQLKVFTENLVQ